MRNTPEIDALNRIATALEKLNDRDKVEELKAMRSSATRNEELGPYTYVPYHEPFTLTSALLSDAAKLINDLMIGRGVDRKNGWRWDEFVSDLYDRAAAFKACEEVE